MAITSTSGVVNGNEITFTIPSTYQGTAKGIGIISYIDYTLGGSDSLTMKYSFNDSSLSSNYYDNIIIEFDTLKIVEISITASGQFRVPLGIARCEESVKITLSGLVDGDINFEFQIDQYYE